MANHDGADLEGAHIGLLQEANWTETVRVEGLHN